MGERFIMIFGELMLLKGLCELHKGFSGVFLPAFVGQDGWWAGVGYHRSVRLW